MAYNGPIWYIDSDLGYDSEDNGSEVQPLESISFAVSRIAQVGFDIDHTIKIKKSSTPYAGADLRSLTPINTKVILTSWNPKIFGIPEVNGMVLIKNNMSVEGLKFSRNGEAISVDSPTIKNITIRSNLFVLLSTAKCILLGNESESMENVKISLNTFVDKGANQSVGVFFYWMENANGIKNSEITSNIFYGNNFVVDSTHDINLMTDKVLTISNNNIFNVIQAVRNAPDPINIISQNPLFVNYALNDFRLQENSPCKDAGLLSESVELDIIGNLRAIIRTYDLGAYEYQDVYFSQIIGGNGFNKGVGVSKKSIVDHTKILTTANADSHFDNDEKWERIIVVYKNPTGQRKIITHKKINGLWSGIVKFGANAEVGVWEKREILVIDQEGDVFAFNRQALGSKEDIYIS